jgi:hypothetical protein
MITHVLLGALHSEPILACLAADGPARPAAAVRALACAVLSAPALGQRAVRQPPGCRTPPHLIPRVYPSVCTRRLTVDDIVTVQGDADGRGGLAR